MSRRVECSSARLIEVIEVSVCRGEGTPEDVARQVIQYWSTEGVLLAERDQWLEQKRAEAER